MIFDVQQARSNFPALKDGFIFADSAGGSQTANSVIERVVDYLSYNNCQLGADYSVSQVSTTRVTSEAPQATATLINAASPDEIIFTSSSTSAVDNLSRGLEKSFVEGDEIIVTGEHETNVGPWVKLAKRRNFTIKFWTPQPTEARNPFSVSLQVKDLQSLITDRTRLVAFTACSNILGEIIDVAEVVKSIKIAAAEKGSNRVLTCVDCVAYAPHRRIDVQHFGVDFAVFSYYKVYGPHVSAMYARKDTHAMLESLVHYFIDPEDSAHYQPSIRLQPGGPGYELTYGTTGVLQYFLGLGSPNSAGLDAKDQLPDVFKAIQDHETTIVKPLLDFLNSRWDSGVRIVGLNQAVPQRAPTVSFIVVGKDGVKVKGSSSKIVAHVDTTKKIGIRYGHFYAHRLLTNLLGDEVSDGVVRVSLVHYHTTEEVTEIIHALSDALATL